MDALLGALIAHKGGQLTPLDLLNPRKLAPGFLRLNIEPRIKRARFIPVPRLHSGASLSGSVQPR